MVELKTQLNALTIELRNHQQQIQARVSPIEEESKRQDTQIKDYG